MASKNSVLRSRSAGTSEPATFESTARRTFESAVELHASARPLATREIHDGVKCLVADAKARGLYAERMLIELKQTWHNVESTAQEKSEVISQLVTMCIHEFYRDGPETVDG